MLRRRRAHRLALAVRSVPICAAACMGVACARGSAPSGPTPAPNATAARVIRVSLGTMSGVTVSATGAWRLADADGRVVANVAPGERIALSPNLGKIRVASASGSTTDVTPPLSVVPRSVGVFVSVNQRRYRGELAIVLADSVLRVINRLDIETYLRGVVPRELGVRGPGDRAALEAQAVAARSYAFTRLRNPARTYDLTATTTDQVYGGADAEDSLANAAIGATAGLVLLYNGRPVNAPYHSTCGGTTAAPEELWRAEAEPFLQRVSDRIPGSDRFYCDIAPRFRWERSWRGDSLAAIVDRYLRAYADVPSGSVREIRSVSVDGRTESGRVAALVIETDRGRYRLRGNDIRYVLRTPGGELLNSTYFTPEAVSSSDGHLARLTIRGLGYGHGVGMCQWGAIGRARAGQDFRTILRTYYPGTTVARAY